MTTVWEMDEMQRWMGVRLIHSPSLVAVRLWVGYDTWTPIGWHHAFVIGLFSYRLGLPQFAVQCGLMWLLGISVFYRGHRQSPCTALMAGNLPAIRAVQGDCEGVYDGVVCSTKYLPHSWWHHVMEMLSTLQALCGGIHGHQANNIELLWVFFVVSLSRLLNKWLRCWWFEMPSHLPSMQWSTSKHSWLCWYIFWVISYLDIYH